MHASGHFGALHLIGTSGGVVLAVGEAERSTSVLIARELRNSRLCCIRIVKANDASSFGATIVFVLNLSLLNFSNGGEKLDEIVVARRPGQLWRTSISKVPTEDDHKSRSNLDQEETMQRWTYITNIDDLVLLSSRGSAISERIWGSGDDSRSGVEARTAITGSGAAATTTTSTTISTGKATTTAAVPAAKSATRSISTSCPKASPPCTKAADEPSTAETARPGESVFTNFQVAALEFIAIELCNCVASIFWTLKCDDTGTFMGPVGALMNIGSKNLALLGYKMAVNSRTWQIR